MRVFVVAAVLDVPDGLVDELGTEASLALVGAVRAAVAGALRVPIGVPIGGPVVLAAFDDAGAAVLAALDAIVAARSIPLPGEHDHCGHSKPLVMVGVGGGEAVAGPPPDGPSAWRALRLATFALPGEALAGGAVRSALVRVPEGVGVFRAPAWQEARAGSPVWSLADHRG